jgi:hypothetical protein
MSDLEIGIMPFGLRSTDARLFTVLEYQELDMECVRAW